ncbi:MAG: hypothetical protein Q9N67_09740 [Ghiorsea sp.]|nr:hypothetical protein [Ghiorsea sp.]
MLLMSLMSERSLMMAYAWMMGDLSHSSLPIWSLLLVWGIALLCGLLLSSILRQTLAW